MEMKFDWVKKRYQDAIWQEWHQHPNGKGWVKNTANVDNNAYVGPRAIIAGISVVESGAIIEGTAVIEGNVHINRDVIIGRGVHLGGIVCVKSGTIRGSVHINTGKP